ncbi:MAG: class I SAM-dependent methyltransferase [Caldilineaceae bacterium]|nr:class I SAM-dependent methyltransferase [Caldilineaceae bacterium]
MNQADLQRANAETRAAWNTNALLWDERMGEGNDFVEVLSWPASERLLNVQPGERVLDIACGNGLTSRRLAALGAEVVACDFSEEMLAHARRRSGDHGDRIRYTVVDATDEAALLALGPAASFDAALAAMALFDMAEIDPLFRALAQLLRPGGRFVFSLMHPCFNNPFTATMGEMTDSEAGVITTYGVKVQGYMTAAMAYGHAFRDQPRPHIYFHRNLEQLLGTGFKNGFVVDGLEERAFPAGQPHSGNPLGWGSHFSEIPPIMVVRMRKSA